jgi:glycosyltransferase involved in cell wall biosynthesis
MFTNTYLPHVGGVARSVSSFSEDLKSLGHRVLIVAPVYKSPDQDDSGEDGVVRVPAIQNFNGSDFSVRLPMPYLIDAQVKAFKPDIIHTHHPFLMGDTALRTAREYHLPLVFTHHTLYEQYTHYVPLDSKVMKRFVIHLVSEYTHFCDAVIAPSRSVAKLLEKRGVTRPIYELPTGIDTKFFADGDGGKFRKQHDIEKGMLVVGHLGRLAKEKNLPYLAEAVCRFLKGRNDACFLLAGTGDAETIIKQIFAESGQTKKLIMVGTLTGTNLADAYQAMDLFVFASKSETQGLVLAEAMAAGTPVIALDASGVREVVEDGVNGFLLHPNASMRSFSKAIQRYVAAGEKKQQLMRQAALKKAEHFTRQKCVRRLLDLYTVTRARYVRDEAKKQGSRLEEILDRLEVEWDLLSGKMEALAETINEEIAGDLN